MNEFIHRLRNESSLSTMVAHHRVVPAREPSFAEPRNRLSDALTGALADQGVEKLYSHQARAIDAAIAGDDVLAVTPTASGKTLVFAVPVLEAVREDPASRGLFLYPTKALAQDQVAGLRALATAMSPLRPPRFEIYDGDTPGHMRRKIKADPPEVLITNPDMLHLGILAYHQDWQSFLRGLRWIVLDELHVYRGVFGAHVHHILARLRRLCARLGAHPRFVAASATVGNPAEFAEKLTGRRFTVVEDSGAPRSERHVVFLNPRTVSPYTAAVRVIAEAARSELRTIAFTKARRVTELLHTWLARQDPALARRIAPYRAGYLPEERRRIEARLFSGELRAVVTTSALELGIDVGDLDVCVLVGYPGSLMSSWQRIGRVGRKERDAAVVLVAMPDALDQYVVSHPDLFFGGAFEHAVLDPSNPIVAGNHLVCAAAEEPIDLREADEAGGLGRAFHDRLVADGRLAADADGKRWYSFRRRPHRDVNPRSAGRPFAIVENKTGRLLGTVDGMRVYHECHPEAIYLHGGRSYLVRDLDDDKKKVTVEPARVDYYTVVLGEKETEILETLETSRVGEHDVGLGRLRVTVRIRGYQKKRLFGGETISEHPLIAPPLIYETVGFWIALHPDWPAAFSAEGLHFMGGIHAVEHATIGLFPLLAIADRGDVGGISYTGHPQVGGPAVFVYDAAHGGAGLAEQGFREVERLLRATLAHVSACECDDGCPSCIQSPRCGNGNKPLDKEASLLVLRAVLGEATVAVPDADHDVSTTPPPIVPLSKHGITRGPLGGRLPADEPPSPPRSDNGETVLVFDLETQRSAEEVGGWNRASEMGLALAVVHDIGRGTFRTYYEGDVAELLLDLAMADRVIGFNIDRFDLRVLSGYTDRDLHRIRTCDMLAHIHRHLGFRLSLQHLAEVNLGESKSADGLQSLKWWKEGRLDLIEEYCRKDVEVTRQLYEKGKRDGYLLYRDRSDRTLRVPVQW
jgi:DEAD/DEAH box helicase domain-containing protein